LQSAGLFGVKPEWAARTAAAIEAVHTYSLVHDDLPCMDDDDLRRGRPTTHKAFDEATAVLAGDALLTSAFEILAAPATHDSAEVRCRLVQELAKAAGSDGMIGGQMIDMQAPSGAFGTDEVILLQQLKTGALFEFCCVAGPILGQAGGKDEDRLRSYARDIGLIFQITDDLLDELGSAEKTGKTVGKDKHQGKATLVSLLGVAAAREKAEALARRAVQPLPPMATLLQLQELPTFLADARIVTFDDPTIRDKFGDFMSLKSVKPQFPHLDAIREPADLRQLDKSEMAAVAEELRDELIKHRIGHGRPFRRRARRDRADGRVALRVRHAA
jgi:farnesyl diphosphate synthase